MRQSQPSKRKYSAFTLEDAMQLVPATDFTPWNLTAAPRPPSANLLMNLRNLEAFDLQTTEQAKTLLMDDLFGEIVPHYPKLKVWKAAALETDTLKGVADYLITPKQAYIASPLLCVAEAKRDDFVQGRAQCIAEMTACRDKNRNKEWDNDLFGIVSNGQDWEFYKLTPKGEILQSNSYDRQLLPELLGVLDYVIAECAKSVP